MTAIGAGSAAVDDIIARADGACYEAKASGRGTVAVFDSERACASGVRGWRARRRALRNFDLRDQRVGTGCSPR